MDTVKYSVVVPIYNAELTIEQLFNELDAVFTELNASYQVVMVDDYSSDSSWKVMAKLKKQYPDKVRCITLAKNSGQHNATLCGIHHADGEFVITIDDDLQIPPAEIKKLIVRQEETGADLTYGTFKRKHHSVVRNAGSWFVNWFFKIFANTSGDGSSFRLIKRSLAENMKYLNQQYLLLDEVLSWYTNSVTNVQVEHLPRPDGASGYSTGKLIWITLNYIINYTAIPLRLMTYTGLLVSFITFFLSLYYVYDKVFNSVELGFTSIIVAILFSSSVIMFCLGIIGEYISRLYIRDRAPHYTIKEIR